MAIPPLVLHIVADSTGVKAGVAQAQASVTGFKGFVTRNSALIRTGALAGAAALAVGFKAAFDAAVEARDAQLKLANSIENSKTVSQGAEEAFIEQADALRELTAVDDEAIIGAQAFLIQMGLTEEQTKRLTPLVVDLSEKMGVDLNSAAKAVGKSVNGTTGGLQRMGVQVDQTKAQTDAYGATLDALGVSQGFAAKSAKAEPWRKLGSEFEELGEELGKNLIPFVQWLTEKLTIAVKWVNDEFIPALKDASNGVGKYAGAWKAAKAVIGVVIRGINAALGTMIATIKTAIALMEELAGKSFSEQIMPALEDRFGTVSPPAMSRGRGRAFGGPVSRGRAYVVGERGPELFVPKSSGNIVPNGTGAPASAGGLRVSIDRRRWVNESDYEVSYGGA